MADVPPELAPIDFDEQRCVQGDVVSILPRAAMKEAVRSNHAGARVAQDRELAVDNGIPHEASVLPIIDADGDEARIEGDELVCVSRELAQFAGAIRSPIPSIEDQKQALPTHGCQMKRLAMFVFKSEIRSGFAGSRSDLWPREDLLTQSDTRKQKEHHYPGSHPSTH